MSTVLPCTTPPIVAEMIPDSKTSPGGGLKTNAGWMSMFVSCVPAGDATTTGSTPLNRFAAVATFGWMSSGMPSPLPSPLSMNGGTPSPSSPRVKRQLAVAVLRALSEAVRVTDPAPTENVLTLWVNGGNPPGPGNGGGNGGGNVGADCTPLPVSVTVTVIVASCWTAKTGSGDGHVMVGGV